MTGSERHWARHIATLVLLVVGLVSFAAESVASDYVLNPGTTDVEVDPTGRVWVSQYHADCLWGFLEGSALASQNVLVVPKCESPRTVTLGPLGAKGYAASWDRYNDGDVVVFDITTGDVNAVLTEGPNDCHYNVAVAPDESWLYFANYYGGSVTKLSLPGGAHVATTSIGSWPVTIRATPDGSHLYVIYNHASGAGTGLRVIETATDTPVFTMTLPSAAHDMEFTPDGAHLYMTAPGSLPNPSGTPHVYVLDTSVPWAPVIADTIDVGHAPHTVALCDSVAAFGLLDGRVCFVDIRSEDYNVIGYEQVAEPTVLEATIHGGDIHGGKAYFAGFTEGSVVHIVDLPALTTPVEASFYGVLTERGTAQLRWTVASLSGVDGFNVYRATAASGPFERLNQVLLLPASPGEFEDATVWPGTTFWYRLTTVDAVGSEDPILGELASLTTGGRLGLALRTAAPNPSGGEAVISYDVPAGVGHATLAVYDVRGRLVNLLTEGPRDSGRYLATWDGTDSRGAQLPSGVYFVRLEAAGEVVTSKISRLR